MGVQLKRKVEPGRNDPCMCDSGLKFKYCHGDSYKIIVCNRVANEKMVELIIMEKIKKGLICVHGVKKGEKCVDCSGVVELESDETNM